MKEGWEYKKLGEIAYIGLGFTHSPNYVSEGVPFISVKDITNGKIAFDEARYVSFDEYENAPKGAKPQKGDVLFCRVGTMGKPLIVDTDKKFCTFVSLGYLSLLSEDYLNTYVRYWMMSKSFDNQVTSNVQGLAIKNLNTGWLKNFRLPIPSLSEQQHIVKELDLLSSIIEKKKAQLNELDNLAQSLFYEMFGDPISNEKGWEIKSLQDVVTQDCTISYGIVQPGENVNNGVPIVRPIDLVGDYVYCEGLKTIEKTISDSYKRTILKGNEILLCVRGTTGLISLASEELKDCNVSRGITPLEINEQMNRCFVFYMLKTPYLQSIIKVKTRGIALKGINMSDVRLLPILTPPLVFQQLFASKIEAIEHQKELIKQSIKEVETLFNSRMDYFFN